jgi:hypothetical protein
MCEVSEDEGVDTGLKCAVLVPSLFFKDEKRAFYHLPSEDHVKGKKLTRTPKKLELVAKASKGKKKKSAKRLKDQRRNKVFLQ